MNESMKKRRYILLVEDNPDDQELARLAISELEMDIDLIVAGDGEEALALLFDGAGAEPAVAGGMAPGLPDMVVLDLKLPKIDGLGVLKAIRAHSATRFIPVVVLTSSREERDVVDSYSFGCNSYVQKPVDLGAFLEATRQLGIFWLRMNISPEPGSGRTQ